MKIHDMSEAELVALIDQAFIRFRGDITEFETAVGMLMVGRSTGWKPLLLVHDKKTVRKYEAILGIELRDMLEPEGKYATKSVAYQAVLKLKSFWKAVRGEITGVRSPEMTVFDSQH